MCRCELCRHHINLDLDAAPTRCVDPVVKYCQGCKYGWIKYPNWVETREDLDGCYFDSGCIYGLEDTQPTEEELEEFYRWWDEWNETQP